MSRSRSKQLDSASGINLGETSPASHSHIYDPYSVTDVANAVIVSGNVKRDPNRSSIMRLPEYLCR